jgi:hypothetical protein
MNGHSFGPPLQAQLSFARFGSAADQSSARQHLAARLGSVSRVAPQFQPTVHVFNGLVPSRTVVFRGGYR